MNIHTCRDPRAEWKSRPEVASAMRVSRRPSLPSVHLHVCATVCVTDCVCYKNNAVERTREPLILKEPGRIEFLTNLLDTDPSETGTDHSDRPQVVQPVGYDDGDVA